MQHIERVLNRIRVAGPLYEAGGERMIGSLFLVEAADAVHARQLVEADPFFAAGIWQSIEIAPFLPAAGTYVGGTSWQHVAPPDASVTE